jgi:hypothetical protein
VWPFAIKILDAHGLDFYLWGQLKLEVYSGPFENEETLHQRIFYACKIIRNSFGTFEIFDSPCVH